MVLIRRRERRAHYGTAQYPNHVPTGGQDCATCHVSAASSYLSWAGGAYVHQASDTNCSSCHNGSDCDSARPRRRIFRSPAFSAAIATPIRPTSFTTYMMNHSAVSAVRCDACHNGSYTGEGTNGALGTASYPNHVATGGRDCVTCHASAASSFTSWAGSKVRPPRERHQLLELPQRHDGDSAMTTPPHIPVGRRPVQQLPHQYGDELCHLYDEPLGGEREPLRLPATTARITGEGTKGAQGTASYAGHVATSGRDCITCHASAGRPSPAGRARLRPPGQRHQLLELPQRHDRDRQDDAAAHPGDRRPVQQLPHQYGGELRHLYDEPFGGEREPLRLLPQRFVHGEGTKGAQGTASYAGHVATSGRDCVTCHASAAADLTSWAGAHLRPPGERHQLLELPQRHDRDRQDHAAAYPGDRRPVQQLPHQYGGELRHLHDEPFGGEREPLRRLPQRLVHERGHQGRARHRVVSGPRRDRRTRLHHLPRQRGSELHELGRRHSISTRQPIRIARIATTV